MIPRLQEKYQKEILPELMKSLGNANVHSVPKLEKIVVNMGVGSAVTEKKHIEDAEAALMQITGQKPVVTLAPRRSPDFACGKGCPSDAK